MLEYVIIALVSCAIIAGLTVFFTNQVITNCKINSLIFWSAFFLTPVVSVLLCILYVQNKEEIDKKQESKESIFIKEV